MNYFARMIAHAASTEFMLKEILTSSLSPVSGRTNAKLDENLSALGANRN